MLKKRTLEDRIMTRVKRSKYSVFLRKDFADLGGYDQVGRVLKQLVEKDKLMRMGYGIYVETEICDLPKYAGDIIPTAPFPELGWQALEKLGAEPRLTQADLDYRSGRSNQMPTGRSIGVRGRISRQIISKNRACIYYERYA